MVPEEATEGSIYACMYDVVLTTTIRSIWS